MQEDYFRLKEHNRYRTIPCLGINDEEKLHPDFFHTPVWCCIARLRQVPYPEYNRWVFEFGYLLKWSKRGKCDLQPSRMALDVLLYICAWQCFLDESTDCSEITMSRRKLCKNEFLTMYVMDFSVTWNCKQDVVLKACCWGCFLFWQCCLVFTSKLSLVIWQRDGYTIYS